MPQTMPIEKLIDGFTLDEIWNEFRKLYYRRILVLDEELVADAFYEWVNGSIIRADNMMIGG